jgi:hypothetical protein
VRRMTNTVNQNSCKQKYFVAEGLTDLWCIRLPHPDYA